jgi:hypothetical protein
MRSRQRSRFARSTSRISRDRPPCFHRAFRLCSSPAAVRGLVFDDHATPFVGTAEVGILTQNGRLPSGKRSGAPRIRRGGRARGSGRLARRVSSREQPQRDAWLTGCVHGRTGVTHPEHPPIREAGAWSGDGGPSLGRTSSIECSLCGQLGITPHGLSDAREMEMFGATQYAWCPLCRRKVEPPWSADYKLRWDALIRS